MYRTFLAALLLFAVALPAWTTAAWSPPTSGLHVVWKEGLSLYGWREGASPTVITEHDVYRPILSPNGERVAFTTAAGQTLESLGVINADGTQEQRLLPLEELQLPNARIHQLAWLDSYTILFNTETVTDAGAEPNNDLYAVQVRNGIVTTYFAPGEAGEFTISPDGQKVALVIPGADGVPGHITLFDPHNRESADLLEFSDNERLANPRVFWSADSASLHTAVVESITEGEMDVTARLWRLAPDAQALMLSQLSARVYGLPQWSHDLQSTIFLQAGDDGSTNLMVGDGSTMNSEAYASGTSVVLVSWLGDSSAFAYIDDDVYSIGVPGAPPYEMLESRMVFGTGPYLVYTTDTELRYALLDNPAQSSLIAPLETNAAFVDAIYVP